MEDKTTNSTEFLIRQGIDARADSVDNSKEALTKLFEKARVEKTSVIIKQIVEDIDEVVRVTRCGG
jgi:hypothetical protein